MASRSDRGTRTERFTGLAWLATLFVVVDVGAILVVGPFPSLDDSAPRIVVFYSQHSGRLLIQGYLRCLSMGVLIVLMIRLAHELARSEPRWERDVIGGAGVAVAAIELGRAGVMSAASLQGERLEPGALVFASQHRTGAGRSDRVPDRGLARRGVCPSSPA